MNTPQETTKTPPTGFGVIFCLVGLALMAWGALGNPSQFQYGPWPVVLVGAIFTLGGFQVLRVTVLHRAVGGPVTAMIAILVFAAFCVLFSWGALSSKVVFLDKHGKPVADPWMAHVLFGVIALICAIGVSIFIFKLVGQLRNRA